MLTLDPRKGRTIGGAHVVSFYDGWMINEAYCKGILTLIIDEGTDVVKACN